MRHNRCASYIDNAGKGGDYIILEIYVVSRGVSFCLQISNSLLGRTVSRWLVSRLPVELPISYHSYIPHGYYGCIMRLGDGIPITRENKIPRRVADMPNTVYGDDIEEVMYHTVCSFSKNCHGVTESPRTHPEIWARWSLDFGYCKSPG